MKLSRRNFLCSAMSAAAASAVPGVALALDYPTRPVRFVVSFAAGGPNDTVARILAQYLSEYLGQQFVVENRVGAGGHIGMEAVLSSPPDGYTIGFVTPNNAINATLYQSLPFDFLNDSSPVAGSMKLANVMDVNLSFPAKDLAAFGELLQTMAGIKLTHVPYRGTAPAMTDLLGGQIPVLFDNLPGSIQQIQAGRIRALGVTTAKRVDSLPDVPAIAESLPGYEVFVWYGICAPKGTPPQVVEKLNRAVNAVLANPKLVARFRELGGEPMPMTPAEFGKLITDETDKWSKVIRVAHIKLE